MGESLAGLGFDHTHTHIQNAEVIAGGGPDVAVGHPGLRHRRPHPLQDPALQPHGPVLGQGRLPRLQRQSAKGAGQMWKHPGDPLDLNKRRKRGAPTPEDMQDFMTTLETTASNMTCVLQEVDYLNDDGQLDPKKWSPAAFSPYANTPAGSHPLFLPGLSYGLDICYNIAQGLDDRVLNLNKVRAKYGRQMVFFQCARKMEIRMCYKWQLATWYKAMGWLAPNWQAMGIANEFEAATYTLRVRNAMRSAESFAVDKFFYGDPEDMFNY